MMYSKRVHLGRTGSYSRDAALTGATPYTSSSSTTSSTTDVKPDHTQLVRRERQTVITDAREALAAAGEVSCTSLVLVF